MVLLRIRRSGSPVTRQRLVIGAVALAAGCAVFEATFDDGTEKRKFDHAYHVDEEGLDCTSCHMGAEDDDRPGMPALGLCRLCHEEPEEPAEGEEPEPDLTAGYFDEEGAYAREPFSKLAEEVIFSHLGHVEAGVDCASCHGDLLAEAEYDASVGVTMAECSSCHEESGAPNDCTVCHSEIDRDWKPVSHYHGWTTAHGPASLAREAGVANDCQLCHVESNCTSCHLENPPADHTNYWRRRGHGAFVALDRTRCYTCHKRDACEECHSITQPVNHVGAWGGRRSLHCGSCHLPSLREEGCYVCHKGAPSHKLASPQPPDHVPGMDCRACHGKGAPLPHFDNGDACSACHQ